MPRDLNDSEISEMNERWADAVSEPDGLQKMAALTREYTEDHIRETSFADKVKTPDKITIEDCDRSVDTYDPIIIDEVDDGQWAMSVDFTGSTKNEIVRQGRYAITIHRIQTATVTYDTDRIRTTRRPIVTHIKRDLGDALANAKDRTLVVNIESAVQFVYKEYSAGNKANGLNATNIADGTVTPYGVIKSSAAKNLVHPVTGLPYDTFETQRMEKADLTDFQNAFNGPEAEMLVGQTMLISNYDMIRTTDWTIESVGDAKVASTVESTKGYGKAKDMEVVRTGKHQYVRPGNVYGFAPWTHLGRYVQLDGIKSEMKTYGTRVEMFEWMYLGMGIAILNGLKKMELYSASSIIGLEDTGYAAVRPQPEEHVVRNNRLDQGKWVPKFQTA